MSNRSDKQIEKRVVFANIKSKIFTAILYVLTVAGVCFFIKYSIDNSIKSFFAKTQERFSFENGSDQHDMVLDSDGIFGYTAADFQDAILGRTTQVAKLQVCQTEVSDMFTLTDTGFINLKAFSKTKVVTYNGIATYTIDLSGIKKADIRYNPSENKVTMFVSKPVLESIDIPDEKIVFDDTEKGLLAFGDIEMTIEEASQLRSEAKQRMEQKLTDSKFSREAERFARLSVWEIYQPIISAVSPMALLEIRLK